MPKKLHDLLARYVDWSRTATCGCSFAFFVFFSIIILFFLIIFLIVIVLVVIVVVGDFEG